jgi:predicted AlkP superfamily pyrophosphatase or phosphodiesterase/broad specificity phosphatase PhoE
VKGTFRSSLFALLLAGTGLVSDAVAQSAAPAVASPAGVRTLYLVRHGAYDRDDPRDERVGQGLLPIGVAQARLAGDRLRGLPFAFDAIVASPMTRARETASVIAAELGESRPSTPAIAIDPDLAECTPPTRRADIMAQEKPEDLAACSAQLERLAPRLLAPLAAGSGARHELVVAHGNVIRWLVTRALGVDPAAWLGMSIGHASLTVLAVDDKGAVRVVAVGDIGHLPPGLQTGAFGLRESWDLAAPVAPAAPPEASAGGPPIVLLISFDGFRWDYPELHGAPTLMTLARGGVRAASLVPSFPSKTYPNHYTLVTGLRPEHHGIVANSMWDPDRRAAFSLADRSAVEDGRWWGGEPIWVGAERRGLVTASSFWPGSEAAIGGLRPTYWKRFDSSVSPESRVDEVLAWLDLPPEKRPRLITLYFDEPDRSGHAFGPASREAAAAVAHDDALVARLRDGIAARGLASAVDWIVVSDHGMTATDPAKTIVLADFIDPADLEPGSSIDPLATFGLLEPRRGKTAKLARALAGAHPHLHVARKEAVPESLHFRAHRRIPALVVWADLGWAIFRTAADRASALADFPGGAHGYDPAERDMQGIFIASGPSFRQGVTTPPLDNVDVYPLLARLLGIPAAANDGDPAKTATMLAEPMP